MTNPQAPHDPPISSSIPSLERFLAQIKLPTEFEHPEMLEHFRVMELPELLDLAEKSPDRRQLFGNYLLEDSLTLLVGERGSSKTYLALQLGLAVAVGATHFLGENIAVHGPVWYINFELSDIRLAKRVKQLHDRGLPLGNASENNFRATSIRKRLDDDMLREITDQLETIKPVLIIIDNYRAAYSGLRADDNSAVAAAMLKLCALKDNYHSAILMVHHTRKGTSDMRSHSDLQSGAGALSDFADADFFIRKSKKSKHQRLLQRGKSRDVDESDTAKLIEYFPESGSMWFECISDGVDESEHIGEDVQRQVSRSESIAWPEIFGNDTELKTSELHRRLEKLYQLRGGSRDRCIEQARNAQLIHRSARGVYVLGTAPSTIENEALDLGETEPNAIYD